MAKSIGIDLGTTNSVVSFIEDNRVETIANTEGSRITPSIVFYNQNDEKIIGELAKRQFVLDPANVVKSAKRIIGKRHDQVLADDLQLPFTVVELSGGMAGIQLGNGTKLRPEEVAAEVLRKLRENAEDFLDEDIVDAVITVPAHFNDQQRTATKEAARLSGLNVTRILNEPTAAALAYGFGKNYNGIVAVFDFGGGTFDISILNISRDIFEVISTNGDNHLGGDDVDNALFNFFSEEIRSQTSVDPRRESQAVQRIREAAEKAKHDLSTMSTTSVSMPFIIANDKGPQHYERSLTRVEFNALNEGLFLRLLEPCKRALEDARLEPFDVSDILLVGGSTRIPRVREIVEEFFGKKPNTSVNPDEAISAGAAIQSAIITGDLREVLLLDVTPLTLGIELAGGVFKPLIDRNSTIPCEASKKFATVVDNQSTVLVRVLQGERMIAKENHFLAEFRLTELPPAPKGLIEVEVFFRIDANGILAVAATDLSTGMKKDVIIDKYGDIGMPAEQIAAKVLEAEKKRADDVAYLQFSQKIAKTEGIHKRANLIFDYAVEELSEKQLKKIKETLFKMDLAINDQNSREVDAMVDVADEQLTAFEANPKIERVLMQVQSQDSIAKQGAFGSMVRASSTSKTEIKIEFDANPKWEEGAGKLEEEAAAQKEAEQAIEPTDYEAIPSLEELESMAAEDLGDEYETAKDEQVKPVKSAKTKQPSKEPAKPPQAGKSPAGSHEPQKRKFAFAPPKIDSVIEEDEEHQVDLSALPPPPS